MEDPKSSQRKLLEDFQTTFGTFSFGGGGQSLKGIVDFRLSQELNFEPKCLTVFYSMNWLANELHFL